MAKLPTVKPVYDVLRQFARERPDVGVGKGLLDIVLDSASPFDPKGVRTPKRWFALLSLLAALMFVCFVYFNRLW